MTARPLLAVLLEWPLRRIAGPVLDMFACLDEAHERAVSTGGVEFTGGGWQAVEPVEDER